MLLLAVRVAAETVDSSRHGDLVFSHLTVRGAMSPTDFPKTGVEIYVKDGGSEDDPGSFLTVIEYRHGSSPKVDRIWDSGNAFLRKIEAIGYRHFDLEREFVAAQQRRDEDAQKRGLPKTVILSVDGFYYSMHFTYAGVDSTIEGWNIGGMIDFHSEFSEDVEKLRRLMEACALQFAKIRLGM